MYLHTQPYNVRSTYVIWVSLLALAPCRSSYRRQHNADFHTIPVSGTSHNMVGGGGGTRVAQERPSSDVQENGDKPLA